jgi:hypothetical protein
MDEFIKLLECSPGNYAPQKHVNELEDVISCGWSSFKRRPAYKPFELGHHHQYCWQKNEEYLQSNPRKETLYKCFNEWSAMKVKHNIIDRHLKLSKNHTRVICNISFSHQIYQWMNARTYNIFCTVIKLDYKLTIIKIAKCSVLLKVTIYETHSFETYY